MSNQCDVNIPLGLWIRARNVRIEGGRIYYVLDWNDRYSFEDAYENTLQGASQDAPHVQFLKWETPGDLARFIGAWGPLHLPPLDTNVKLYRRHRDLLRATVKLVQACREQVNPRKLREVLDGYYHAVTTATQATDAGDAEDWVNEVSSLSIPDLRQEVTSAVENSEAMSRAGLTVRWQGHRPQVAIKWMLTDLEEALNWMVFADINNRRPIGICPECGNLVRPITRRLKKFCSYECAHREAARNWRRKDLEKKREERIKRRRRP